MCTQHNIAINSNSKAIARLFSKTALIYLIMIVLGILSGMSGITFLQILGITISDIFIKIFKCISLPIIALSVIVTLASYSAEDSHKRIWQQTIKYTISTTVVAAGLACLLYLIVAPANVDRSAIPLQPEHIDESSSDKKHYFQHLVKLIPANIFAPFLEHQVMGVLLVGIIVGLAIRNIPENGPKKTLIMFFQGIHSVFIVITKWVVAVIPIGLYGFITSTVVQLKAGIDIGSISKYLLVVILANIIQGFVILPLWLKYNKISPFATMRKMMPALSVAFFSKSSAGTLPVTMEAAEKNVGILPRISRFVLPLCTTINMNGCAAFIFTTVIYLMQNHGIELSIWTMLTWIVIATIAAVGNAGVPMGCFFLSASLLASMDIPITLLGIILPFYTIIDMVETALNVWSDTCVTTIVNKKYCEDINTSFRVKLMQL